jgi:hypothetical protein
MTQSSQSRTKKLLSKGWAKLSPGTHERTQMKKSCGDKCFLGPKNETCFPICAKGTCEINDKGIYAAYVRAREYGSKKMPKRSSTKRSSTKRSSTKRSSTKRSSTKRHTKKLYNNIAAKAKKMLKKRGFGPNLK